MTPQGTLSYSQTGTNSDGTPQYTQTDTLSPTAQGQYDQAAQIAGALGSTSTNNLNSAGTIQNSLNYSGVTPLTTSSDFSSENQQAQNAAYSQATSRLDPQWANNDSDLNSQLAAQGISQNSDAYQRAQTTESNAKTDAYNQANYSAIGAGDTEASTLQNEALAARQQGVNEVNDQGAFTNTAQSQSASQASSIASLLSQLSNPTYNPVSQVGVAAPDYSDLTQSTYNDQLQAYNTQQQQQSQGLGSIFGTLGSLGSSALSYYSDRRLKENIRHIGQLANGLVTYAFNYIGGSDQQFGVMAQEVLQVLPEAVSHDASGYMYVDYRKVYA